MEYSEFICRIRTIIDNVKWTDIPNSVADELEELINDIRESNEVRH